MKGRTLNHIAFFFCLIIVACQSNSQSKQNQEIGVGVLQLVLSDSADSAIEHAIRLMPAKIGKPAIYQWKNRMVCYGDLAILKEMAKVWGQHFPANAIHLFQDPYYVFDRKRCRTDTTSIKETEAIILSANLVEDKKMQQEYLNYHAHQFEQWPEVAQGFCRAQFQQVLCYQNGRQLMLVINIPKGKDFENLDKETTANNPRVNEWNRLMAQYQEGLPGTMKGETWVFFVVSSKTQVSSIKTR